MDSKAACAQLNLAHETKTNASTHSVQIQYRFKIRDGIKRLWRKRLVKDMSFKSEVKDSDGESEGGDCDEVICAG